MKQTGRFIYYTAPALLLGLLFFSCTKTEEPALSEPESVSPTHADTTVVAAINGDPITLGEFMERFSRAGLKPEQGVDVEVKEDFLNRLIERKMMLKEAQRRRIKVGLPEINSRIEGLRVQNNKDVKETLAGMGIDFEKWKADVWEDLMIEKLLSAQVNKRVTVSSVEVRRYYQEHLYEFEKPEQVHVRQIVVATEGEARKALERLKAGSDFASVAREKSTAPEAERGGDLGYFGAGDMPPEFNVVFTLKKGERSGIVKSPYGYHIFRLEDKRAAGRISVDEAYPEIAETLRRAKEDRRYKSWFNELRSRTKLEVNYKALDY